MSAEENKEVVLSFIENLGNAKWDACAALMASDAKWWVAGTIELSGTLAPKEIFAALEEMNGLLEKPLKLEPTTVTAEADRVAVEADAKGKTKTGKIYDNPHNILFECRDAKIQTVREYFDTHHAVETFG